MLQLTICVGSIGNGLTTVQEHVKDQPVLVFRDTGRTSVAAKQCFIHDHHMTGEEEAVCLMDSVI